MARNIMRAFRLTEISAVDKPAQKLARAVIMKRDGEGDTEEEAAIEQFVASSPAGARLLDLAAAMHAIDPSMPKEKALHYLLHLPEGRALFRTFKGEHMTREQELQNFVKNDGAVKIAKRIIDEGNSHYRLTEVEFTKLVQDHASLDRRGGESPAQAFARIFSGDASESVAFRQAHAIIKNFPQMMLTAPTQVGDRAALDISDPADALAQLQDLAAKQRQRSPELTIEQAFAMVYAAPENRGLAARERARNRPV